MKHNYPYDYISHLVKNEWTQKEEDSPIFFKEDNKIVIYPDCFIMVYKKNKLAYKGNIKTIRSVKYNVSKI